MKKRRFSLPRLYPITDARLSGLTHAEQVTRLCESGAKLIQLREKDLSPRDFYREAAAALEVAQQRGVALIINDRADIALALGAAGVHVGQDDLPPAAARHLLGTEAIVGFSTHNAEQARAAARVPLDYIAIGPVFATNTKANPDPVVGLEGVRRVREALGDSMPLVAIGGITWDNALDVLAAGADSVALIGALWATPQRVTEIFTRLQ